MLLQRKPKDCIQNFQSNVFDYPASIIHGLTYKNNPIIGQLFGSLPATKRAANGPFYGMNPVTVLFLDDVGPFSAPPNGTSHSSQGSGSKFSDFGYPVSEIQATFGHQNEHFVHNVFGLYNYLNIS